MSNYVQFRGNNPFGSQAKMLYHTDRIHEYLTTGDTWPIFIEWNLTDKCNLKCKWCISENCRSKNTIDFNVAAQFLWDFKNGGGKAITFSGGGEPTLHPDFLILLELADHYGLDVGIMSNGVFPEYYCRTIGEVARWIRISVDTLDQTKYKKLKGLNAVGTVLENIDRLSYYDVKVGVNCNVGPDITVDDVDMLVDLIGKVQYVQFRPVLPRYFKKEAVVVNTEVWEHLKDNYSNNPNVNFSDDKLSDLTSCQLFPFTSCEGHFFNPVVQANGDVAVCMYHPNDDDFVFGNLNNSTFPEIWNSKRRKQVTQKLRELDYTKKCQVCCKLTELNKFIDFITYPDKQMDNNFL